MGTRVYLGRLPYHVREKDVERFFKGYGKLRDIMLKNGYGFVEFEDYRDADDAVYELNGKDMCGERVSVEHARGTPRGSDRYYDSSFDRYPPRRGGGGGGARRNSARDKYGPPTRTDNRLIVENLSSRVSWQDTMINWSKPESMSVSQSVSRSKFIDVPHHSIGSRLIPINPQGTRG